jgi:hypothetical protein
MAHFFAITRKLAIVLVEDLSDLRIGGKLTLKCTNEDTYEKKLWLDEQETSGLSRSLKRVKMLNDLLQIEPIEKADFGVYTCLFVDEFGEKKLEFKVDDQLVRTDDLTYLDTAAFVAAGNHHAQTMSLFPLRLSDLKLEVNAIRNFKKRISLRCRSEFGKS